MNILAMRKIITFSMILIFASAFCLSGCSAAENNTNDFTLTMQIDNPIMSINGTDDEIDKGRDTVPVVLNNRTFVPIRAIIEAMGGKAGYDDDTKTIFLEYNGDFITLAIGNTTAYFNETANILDAAPMIINGRTMLPIIFIAESYKFNVNWIQETQTVIITKTS